MGFGFSILGESVNVLLASSSSGSRGGGELFLVSLAEALRRRDVHAALWCSRHRRMDELAARFAEIGPVYRDDYLNTYDRRGRALSSAVDLFTARRVAAAWRRIKPDVVHLNKQNLEDGLDLIWAANQSGSKSVCTIHVSQTARYLRAQQAALRDFAARFVLHQFRGKCVAVGRSRFGELQNFLGPGSSTHLIENGVPIPSISLEDRRAARSKLGIAPNESLFLAVGRMVEQKRPRLFVDLARQIAGQQANAVFRWVGDGELRSEFEKTTSSFQDRIKCTGWVHQPSDYFAAADCFIHTAAFEGLPLALLEALAAGLPALVTANLVADLPFLTDQISINADSSGWLELIANPEELKYRGAAARAFAQQHFSVDRMADEYLALYQS